MQPYNSYGSFLVHNSETVPGEYVLSIRDTEKVEHYKIHRADTGDFFISSQLSFDTITKLVQYYKTRQMGCVST